MLNIVEGVKTCEHSLIENDFVNIRIHHSGPLWILPAKSEVNRSEYLFITAGVPYQLVAFLTELRVNVNT